MNPVFLNKVYIYIIECPYRHSTNNDIICTSDVQIYEDRRCRYFRIVKLMMSKSSNS